MNKKEKVYDSFNKPAELTGLDAVFGPAGTVFNLLPRWEDIPEEFKSSTVKDHPYVKVVGDWFFSGVKILRCEMKPGVDKKMAIKHIGCVMHSYEPKHEHKIAGAAYLMSLWFEKFEAETR